MAAWYEKPGSIKSTIKDFLPLAIIAVIAFVLVAFNIHV